MKIKKPKTDPLLSTPKGITINSDAKDGDDIDIFMPEGHVHIERMSADQIWIALYPKADSTRRLVIWLNAEIGGTIGYTLDRE